MAKSKSNKPKKAKEDTLEETTQKANQNSKSKNKEGNAFVRFFKGVGKWFHDLKVEFRNVSWPSWHTTSVNTGIVLATIVASSVIVGLLDLGMLELLQFLLGLGVSK